MSDMELWLGQVVVTKNLSDAFRSGLQNYKGHFGMMGEPDLWLIGDDGLPIEHEQEIHGREPVIKLHENVDRRHLLVNSKHVECGVLILGVRVDLDPEPSKLRYPESGSEGGHLSHPCFNITEILLTSPACIQSRIDEVRELLWRRSLPCDRVGLIVSGPLS